VCGCKWKEKGEERGRQAGRRKVGGMWMDCRDETMFGLGVFVPMLPPWRAPSTYNMVAGVGMNLQAVDERRRERKKRKARPFLICDPCSNRK
jgi:hypothetical protein